MLEIEKMISAGFTPATSSSESMLTFRQIGCRQVADHLQCDLRMNCPWGCKISPQTKQAALEGAACKIFLEKTAGSMEDPAVLRYHIVAN